jgi:hypothetical protein
LEDPTRVSEDLIEKKDVNKRVRSLTKLTKEYAVADLTADYFDSVHPLPEVCICLLFVHLLSNFHVSQTVFSFSLVALLTCSCAGAPIPPLPEAGPLPADLASSVSEAPEAYENQDGDDAKESEEDTSSSTSPPPVHSEDTGVDKKRKRKRVDEFASSSSSLQKAVADKAYVLAGDMEYFDLLAS